MIRKLNTNLVRIFSGTYESIWEVSETDDDGNELEVDYKHSDLMKSIAEEYQAHAKKIKKLLNLTFINSISFTGETWSPREYNFTTDQLDFNMDINKIKLLESLRSRKNDGKLSQFLIDNYRSRDGFISFTPDNYGELVEQIVGDGDECDQAIGAYITYLAGDTFNEIEEAVYEDWQGNGYGGLDYKIVE